MSRFKLASQINLIFSFVTVISGIIFIIVLNLTFTNGLENQNKVYLTDYQNQIKSDYNPYTVMYTYNKGSIYNDYVILQNGRILSRSSDNVAPEKIDYVISVIQNTYLSTDELPEERKIDYKRYEEIAYQGLILEPIGLPVTIIITISNTNDFISDMTGNVPYYATLAFLNILVLGNLIIWLWSSNTVTKLRDLQTSIDQMISNDYQNEVTIEAAEEIQALAKSIDKMREEIQDNERIKKEMIQNLGHDLKTPIAVIKSYAEAILDGVEDIESAALITKQADVLTKKVHQIIEFNKAGYLRNDQPIEQISMNQSLISLVNNYKYITNARITLNVESDWVHPMVKENFYVAISNILDNAVRYVKTQIVITLKNKKLTIFNDGEQIDPEFLPRMFKAYEKGSKGQFGLGLAIVKRTLDMFGLQISVCNYFNGVMFTIEPK